MAIWHHSLSKPGYKAYVTIVKHRENQTDFKFDTITFEGNNHGEVVLKVENYIDKYFATLNKSNYSVTVRIDSYVNYDLQI